MHVVNLVDAALLLAALLAATLGAGAFVAWNRRRVEPRRQPHRPGEIVEPHRLGAVALGENATLLQFSTELCTRCPGVHRTLSQIADGREGVLHLDIDLTHRPDIARHFQVLQTPTTLVLDRDGAVQTRFGGTPGRGVIELALARVTDRAPA